MKIKHFSGYGSVEAKRIKLNKYCGNVVVTTIRVTGNHERGLVPYDESDAIRWLLARYEKNIPNYVEVKHEWQSDMVGKNGEVNEVCDFTFRYQNGGNGCDNLTLA